MVFLLEVYQVVDQDYVEDDDDVGEIGFFIVLQGQLEVGEEVDCRECYQYIDEGVVECLQQLYQDVWWMVVGYFVGVVGVQLGGGFGLVEVVLVIVDIGEGGFQVVLCFVGGVYGQLVVVVFGVELGIVLGCYVYDLVFCCELCDGDMSWLLVR